mmetsp:Transcript_30645/g.61372  ORF Transcript_30645/g.61372 Transcript_30645/m.61372 type:complete len:164 (+) Transcript_30645:408-899(+)
MKCSIQSNEIVRIKPKTNISETLKNEIDLSFTSARKSKPLQGTMPKLTYRLFSNEIVILRQKQHTVTFMPLPHRNTRAIPITFLRFFFLILVKSARTQRRPQSHLMLRKPLNHNSRDTLIRTIKCSGIFSVFVRKSGHGLESLFHRDFTLFVGHIGVLRFVKL